MAQISRTGVQLHTVEVMGTVIMRVSGVKHRQEAKGSTSLGMAGATVELNIRAAAEWGKKLLVNINSSPAFLAQFL